MLINITKNDDGFEADCLDLPGSPPVGRAKTKEGAVASLFIRIISEKTMGRDSKGWVEYIDPKKKVRIVNCKVELK